MPFELLPLSTAALECLADSRVPVDLAERAEPGSMPPAFVATRALVLEAQPGRPALPTSYLIVRLQDARFVGACGFKTRLCDRRFRMALGAEAA